MNKQGILNPAIAAVIRSMGHGDLLVIGDAGLPIPAGVTCIDLSLIPGVPDFMTVLSAVLQELVVEKVYLAKETEEVSPKLQELIQAAIGVIPSEVVSHDVLKETSAQAMAVIRTGECTPYANIILSGGVTF